MRDTKFYICKYCYKDFEPKRRRVQKYCSNTCRSKAHHARKTNTLATSKFDDLVIPDSFLKPNSKPTPIAEKMSLAGVGNSAAGTLAVDLIKNALTTEPNKAATKGDLSQLIGKIKGRYHLITNMKPNPLGQHPYFDLVENKVEYL